LFRERGCERSAQLPRIDACDRREDARLMRCGSLRTTTLGKTLRFAQFLLWILWCSDEELECDGGKRIDVVRARWWRTRETLRRSVRRYCLRRYSDFDQRLRKPEACDCGAFTVEDDVGRRHHPVIHAQVRCHVDGVGQLLCALQDFCNRA